MIFHGRKVARGRQRGRVRFSEIPKFQQPLGSFLKSRACFAECKPDEIFPRGLVLFRKKSRTRERYHTALNCKEAAECPVPCHLRTSVCALLKVLLGHLDVRYVRNHEESPVASDCRQPSIFQSLREKCLSLSVGLSQPGVIALLSRIGLQGLFEHLDEGLLHRRARTKLHEGKPQLDGRQKPFRPHDPSNLPAGDRERFACRRDGDRAVPHAWEGREVNVPDWRVHIRLRVLIVLVSVDHELVDLIGEHQNVRVLPDHLSDSL
mmetsp:Transcript_44223/g.87236  ORF Transcript_44223/g.87236 Transcript_44223/m.87236 type:complete len:264 (-) Transcript_44223:927-1718(-)